jgi:hypothetical protein
MLVLADGPLNNVPFASLPVPGAGGDCSSIEFVLGYAPSLALALENSQPDKSRNTRVAVVSDPCMPPTIAGSASARTDAPALCAALRPLSKQPDTASLFGARGERCDQGIWIGRHHTIVRIRATATRVLQLPSN